jgi:hypothetical protein
MRGRISRAFISALSALSSDSRLSERGEDTLEALRRTDALADRDGSLICHRYILFYLPPADNLFIDGQTVPSNSYVAIAVLHGSIDKSVGQYDPRFVNLLGLYSWYLYLKIFLYIVTQLDCYLTVSIK